MKTTHKTMLFVTLFASLAARVARAADGEAPATVVAAPTAAQGTADDPNIDRALLLPTAMTQPAGSATYNNYELFLHGFTYGVTDRVQTSLTVLAPFVKDMPFFGLLAGKWQVASLPRLHVAVQGSAGLLQSFTAGSERVTTLGVGAFTSVCLRADCSSLLSASATYQAAMASGDAGQMIIYGGSIVHGVSEHVKLLAELTSATGRGPSTQDSFNNMPGLLASYGVRLHGTKLASDIGFIRPITTTGDNSEFILGLPFASISYRWL
jgi:hypothetical protein